VGAQRAQHAEAIQFRQHHVQDDHVVVVLGCQMRPLLPVKGDVDHPALLGQPGAQVLDHLVFIFNDQ
jgi:hypothetical protein